MSEVSAEAAKNLKDNSTVMLTGVQEATDHELRLPQRMWILLVTFCDKSGRWPTDTSVKSQYVNFQGYWNSSVISWLLRFQRHATRKKRAALYS